MGLPLNFYLDLSVHHERYSDICVPVGYSLVCCGQAARRDYDFRARLFPAQFLVDQSAYLERNSANTLAVSMNTRSINNITITKL